MSRINALPKDVLRLPFSGLDKPESLRHALSGFWSRRIDDEHRIVHKPGADALLIALLRHCY